MSIIFALLLALLVSWLLAAPHISPSLNNLAHNSSEKAIEASDQKTRCLQSLNDLEHDFATNKLSEKDYTQTRKALVAELDKQG